MPIIAARPRALSVMAREAMTPTRARGSVSTMTKGFRRLPRLATMTR